MSQQHPIGRYTARRRYLRANMPTAEVILWSELKGKQLFGYKFRRQHSFGSYVVDFYCPRLKLVIELDGDSHVQTGAAERDRQRQHFIESFEVSFLRFTNTDIYENLTGVIDTIIDVLPEDLA